MKGQEHVFFFFNVSHENNFPWSVFNQRKSGRFLNLQNLKGPERFAVNHDLTRYFANCS